MPRSTTTSDVFNAVAEPRRREIVTLLARRGAMPVGNLVGLMGISQPSVSKHLCVLHDVGVVSVRQNGKQRIYQLEAEKLKTIYDWAKSFESLWDHQLARIKAKAEERASKVAKTN